MLKLIFIIGLFSTGCIHSTSNTDLEYQVKILERRLRLIELDMQYMLEDECVIDTEEVENTLWEFANTLDPIGY